MKYQPGLPQHNDNISDEHPLKDFVVITAWLLAFSVLAFWLLGLAIDATVDSMSPATEARLHAMLPAQAVTSEPKAAAQQVQLQAMVDSMRACARLTLPSKVAVSASAVPNAMVVPGGQIIVFSGLFKQVKSENGLAYVLAHEMAHVTQRDHLRALGRGIVLFGMAALLTGSDSGLSELLTPVGNLGQAKYSRTREAAADMAALRILHCRYGHAGGATEFFEAMRDEEQSLFGLTHYAASHPAMQERIDALNAAIKASGMPVQPGVPLQIAPIK
ncbi:MAG: M48 family metallopeptidase [Pseudomonadota bacterium]